MKSNDFLSEDIASDAHEMHLDHEVQMARKDCYAAADDAIALHKLLRNISEQQGLEGWVAAKITLASDYLNTVREHLEYQLMSQVQPDWSAFGVGKVNLPKHKGAVTKHKMVGEESDPQTWTTIEDVEFIQDLMDRAFEAGSNALGNTLQGVLEKIKYNQDDEEQMNEKAVAGDLKYELDEQGVAEGKINTARMNKPHQDFYSKNPHFKRDDKEVVAQGGKLATKVSPSGTKQVSKKPATPFGKTVSEDASGGASAAGSVAGVNNPGGKPKSQVGSLFGGTYQRKKKTTSK